MRRVLKRRNAVLTPVVGMWILAVVGVSVLIRTGHWFILSGTDESLIRLHVVAFHLAYFAAKLPAIAFVAFIIAHSGFRRPALVAVIITGGIDIGGAVN